MDGKNAVSQRTEDCVHVANTELETLNSNSCYNDCTVCSDLNHSHESFSFVKYKGGFTFGREFRTPQNKARSCRQQLLELVNVTSAIQVHPITWHEGTWVQVKLYSLTSVLDGGGWLTPCPGGFTPTEWPGINCTEGWMGPRVQSGRMQKISPAAEFDSRTVQPVASSNTDHAIPGTQKLQ